MAEICRMYQPKSESRSRIATRTVNFEMGIHDWWMRLYGHLPTLMEKQSRPYHRLRSHRGGLILITWVHQDAPFKR